MEKPVITDRQFIYKGSRIEVYKDVLKIPNGNVVSWDFVKHIGAAAVVPVTKEGKIVMVRQYRNALDRETLEIPAGGLNSPDEPTLEAAVRELEEETGYISPLPPQKLISIVPAIAYCDEVIDIYVAKDLERGEKHPDEDEFINVEEYELDMLVDMIYKGIIQDSKTVSAIFAYKNLLNN